jgi:hypothetical protein
VHFTFSLESARLNLAVCNGMQPANGSVCIEFLGLSR